MELDGVLAEFWPSLSQLWASCRPVTAKFWLSSDGVLVELVGFLAEFWPSLSQLWASNGDVRRSYGEVVAELLPKRNTKKTWKTFDFFPFRVYCLVALPVESGKMDSLYYIR